MATRGRAGAAEAAAAVAAAAARSRRPGATRPADERAADPRAAPPTCCATPPARARGAGGARVREAVGRGRRRRVRGDRLPRVLRARGGRARARARAAPGARRAQHDALRRARRRRGDRAVELPDRDPVRDDGRRARRGQRGRAEAGRAVARVRATRWSSALREAGVPAGALALLPGFGDAGAALVRAPGRAHDRVHRLERGRARDRPRRGGDARRSSAT